MNPYIPKVKGNQGLREAQMFLRILRKRGFCGRRCVVCLSNICTVSMMDLVKPFLTITQNYNISLNALKMHFSKGNLIRRLSTE